MLSSAKKVGPTIKQFVQPYFIEIAPDGAITAVCTRFTTLLQKKNIHKYQDENILNLFSQLGCLDYAPTFNFPGSSIPRSFDLSMTTKGGRPYIIRWIPSPAPSNEENTAAGWQLTGMKIYTDPRPDAPRTGDGHNPLGAAHGGNGHSRWDTPDARANGMLEDELRYQANLVKYVSDIIISTDLHNRIIHWNPAAEKFYGISAQEAIGKNFREIIKYEFINISEEKVIRLLMTQGYWDGEAVYFSPAGKRSYLLSSVRFIRDNEDQVTGVVAVNKDITENKLAQEEIIRIKTAIDNTSDAIGITDTNFNLIYQNPSHQTIFRRNIRQWNSESGILTCIRSPALSRKLVTELQNGRSWSGDIQAYDRSGLAIDFSLRSDSIQNLKGGTIGYIWSFTDIRERKRAEEQLRQYSEQIINILDSITDGFFVLDKSFRVTLWNHEAERITSLSSAEMVGNNFWDKFPEMVDTDTHQSFLRSMKKKITVTFEQYNERWDRWLETSVYPSAQGLFVYFRDVTVRKKQEAMLALEKKVLELNSNKKASLQTIMNYFLKGVEKIFPEMYCSVLTLHDDGVSVRHISAPRLPAIYSHAIDGLPIGPQAGSCGTAMFRKERVIVTDISADPLWAHARELALQFGLQACWSLPVLDTKGEVLGAFATYYKTTKEPTEVELGIIERAANLIRIIIVNNLAEEELKISNERYMLATKATNDAIWDWDMATELYFWGEGFYDQFGYKPVPKVRTRKFWETHIHTDDRTRVLKNMEKFIQKKDKGLWLEEYRFRKSDGKYALISDRGFLVFGKEGKVMRMVGSMQDITEKREMEKRLLKQELNKQKLIAQAMVDAQEKERAEIGKELHDNINQILSTTKLYLELAKNDNKERLNLIGRSAENIHEAIHEIRNISRSLVPSSIGDLGLLDSISDLVESIRTTRAIHVEFYPVGGFDEKLSDKEKLMLFRIIQEQVNNVMKHSGARNLIIELILDDMENRIELNITDDGKGFNPGKIKNKKGLGLSNIMSRADLFGGKVTIMSAPGQGCKLRVQVPVQ
jgi:PAS domain S-box-containing protein